MTETSDYRSRAQHEQDIYQKLLSIWPDLVMEHEEDLTHMYMDMETWRSHSHSTLRFCSYGHIIMYFKGELLACLMTALSNADEDLERVLEKIEFPDLES